MENISRGPTFGDFVTIRTEGVDAGCHVTVARLQSARVHRLPSPPSFKCNVLRESLSVECGQSKYSLHNTKEKGVVGNLWIHPISYHSFSV
jgi:hypothetical protein